MVRPEVDPQVCGSCVALETVRTSVWVYASVLLDVVVHAAFTLDGVATLRAAVLFDHWVVETRHWDRLEARGQSQGRH